MTLNRAYYCLEVPGNREECRGCDRRVVLDVEGEKVGAKREKRRGSAICADTFKYLLPMSCSRRKNRTLIRRVMRFLSSQLVYTFSLYARHGFGLKMSCKRTCSMNQSQSRSPTVAGVAKADWQSRSTPSCDTQCCPKWAPKSTSF